MKNMMESSLVQRIVMHWGVWFLGKHYYHPKLLKYEGTIVFARMTGKRLRITDRTGEFICLAETETFV